MLKALPIEFGQFMCTISHPLRLSGEIALDSETKGAQLAQPLGESQFLAERRWDPAVAKSFIACQQRICADRTPLMTLEDIVCYVKTGRKFPEAWTALMKLWSSVERLWSKMSFVGLFYLAQSVCSPPVEVSLVVHSIELRGLNATRAVAFGMSQARKQHLNYLQRIGKKINYSDKEAVAAALGHLTQAESTANEIIRLVCGVLKTVSTKLQASLVGGETGQWHAEVDHITAKLGFGAMEIARLLSGYVFLLFLLMTRSVVTATAVSTTALPADN